MVQLNTTSSTCMTNTTKCCYGGQWYYGVKTEFTSVHLPYGFQAISRYRNYSVPKAPLFTSLVPRLSRSGAWKPGNKATSLLLCFHSLAFSLLMV